MKPAYFIKGRDKGAGAFPLISGISRCSWLLLLSATAYIAWFWFNRLYLPYFPYGQAGDDSMFIGDSLTYIRFHELRTAGYPLFIDLVTFTFGSLEAVPRVQLVLQAGTIALLGWSMHRTFAAPWLTCCATLLLFALSALTQFHFYIMSEALLLPLLFTMLASLLLLLSRPTVALVFCAALLCGLAISVRQAAMSLLLIWPVLLCFLWRQYPGQNWRLTAAVLVPLAFCWLAESAVWHGFHPQHEERPNLAYSNLLAKAMMLEREPPVEDAQLRDFLASARHLMSPLRELAYSAPNQHLRTILLEQGEYTGQYAPHIHLLHSPTLELAMRRGISHNRAMGEAGKAALLAVPAAWLGNALTHYAALWFNSRVYGAKLSRQYAVHTAGAENVPLLREAGITDPLPPKPQWLVLLNRAGTVTLFAASIMALGFAAWLWLRRGAHQVSADLAGAALCALIVHGYFLLIGLFGIAQTRYAATLWPLQVLCALLLLHWALSRWRRPKDNG